MKKKLSMILFVSWSVLVVLILTFGTTVAGMITKFATNIIHSQFQKLTDVEVFLEDEYIIEESYRLEYITYPENNYDKEIVFTSLTPEIFTIKDGEIITGLRTNQDKTVGKLLITSNKYPNFKKEVEINFTKVYPDKVDFMIFDKHQKDIPYNKLYIGMNYYLYSYMQLNNDSNAIITENSYEFIYDENYFTYVEDGTNGIYLKTKVDGYQIGDTFDPINTTIQMKYNGKIVKSYDVTINPLEKVDSFDKIMLSYVDDNIEITDDIFVDDNYFIRIYQENQEKIIPYVLETSDEDIMEIKQNLLMFHKAGNVKLTITLENGFQKEYNILVRNHLVEPKISNLKYNEEGKGILLTESNNAILIKFDKEAKYQEWSYELITDLEKVATEQQKDKLIISSMNTGSAKLKIIVDDGFEEPIIKVIDLIIIQNPHGKSRISKVFGLILGKVAGHFSFFILQAILAFWMMYYYKGKKQWLNVIIFLSFGLFIASLTEFIQLFIPGRSGRIIDVLLDMSGYLLGTLVAYLIYLLIKKKKMKEGIKNEK